MTSHAEYSNAIARGKAVVDRLEAEFAQCRADPVKARRALTRLRQAQSDLAWLVRQREALQPLGLPGP